MGYHWFDVPAYEDFDKKMQMALKYSLMFGEFSACSFEVPSGLGQINDDCSRIQVVYMEDIEYSPLCCQNMVRRQ